ncbi:MAG: hypothetical protein IK002_04880 [Treponema sp.]|uniref:hypothetical protein n=1 Tax=Treponema sp. TaxID=166 RepID=UPI00298E0B87|nr:hypothetical protein [Treponema sp.]MBR5933303.1 hypothetical protein [Treponema sp.]
MAQILIENGKNWYEFSKSKTGQLDFVGKWENDNLPDTRGCQKIIASTYYTPSYYVYIQDELNFNSTVYAAADVDISDKDTFEYLVHIGALLAAVETKNSLLAGDLFLRRMGVFAKFAQLTQFILEPICVEILFSLCYGKLQNVNPDTIPLVYEAAKTKLEFDSARETIDQAMMRYFKKNEVTLTLPLVGTSFYHWGDDIEPKSLTKLTDNLSADNLSEAAEKIRKAKHGFYEGLDICVQAEPYNTADRNSILVCIDSIEAKLFGNAGLKKAGHLRALAAKIIREAKPKKMAYDCKLESLTYREYVVKITV